MATDYDSATRQELYREAARRGISGRSSMSKQQLRQALTGDADDADGPELKRAVSRVEDFRRLSETRARGGFVALPRMLSGHDRRTHVRQTIREDHQERIATGDEDARAKFDKLAGSLFSFFRGTALLFYRDMAGEDPWMPTVLALGDVHPGNFGVMPNADNVPIFGPNDFDEAAYAPFTWDLRRGATGFMLAAGEAGHGRKRQRRIARRFLEGYVEGIRRFAEEGREQSHEVRLDNAPALIRDLLRDATEQSRPEWLAEKHLDEFRRGFGVSEKIIPISGRREQFQGVVEELVRRNDIGVPARAGDMRVKDVAIRRGAGTQSLGLDRYLVLIEGPSADGSDDLVIEFKQARRSALQGLAPSSGHETSGAPGERIAHAQKVQLVRGDRFYGSVDIEGVSFMSRERAPYRDDLDLEDLSKSGWCDYAAICGEALAHAHALSDEIGPLGYDIEPMIVDAIGTPELFVDDMVAFAHEAAERTRDDHAGFRADHALGAFTRIDIAFR